MKTKFEINYSHAPIPNEIDVDINFKVGDLVRHYNNERHTNARVTEVAWVLDDCEGEVYRVVSLEDR